RMQTAALRCQSRHSKNSGTVAGVSPWPPVQSAAWHCLTSFWQPPTSVEARAELIQVELCNGGWGRYAFPKGRAAACVGVDGGCLRNATGDDGQQGYYRKPVAEIQ